MSAELIETEESLTTRHLLMIFHELWISGNWLDREAFETKLKTGATTVSIFTLNKQSIQSDHATSHNLRPGEHHSQRASWLPQMEILY